MGLERRGQLAAPQLPSPLLPWDLHAGAGVLFVADFSAPGRNAAVLDDLRARFGQRIVPVRLSGDGAVDTETMKRAAPGPIDSVQDCLPPSAGAAVASAVNMTLRQGGRALLMGGLGMLGGEDLALPYLWIMRNLITARGKWI